jgi:hypothetical protein
MQGLFLEFLWICLQVTRALVASALLGARENEVAASMRRRRRAPAELDLPKAHRQRNGGEGEQHQHPEYVDVG